MTSEFDVPAPVTPGNAADHLSAVTGLDRERNGLREGSAFANVEADTLTTHASDPNSWSLEEMLDALDGTAYVTDLEGRLVCVGQQNWDSFAKDNAGGALAASPPIGHRVTDGISGELVSSIYQRAHKVAVSGARRIAFTFRCDAPDVERRMKMAIGPLRLRKTIVGVLYQSTILSERARPPMRFLEVSAALEQLKEDAAPIIACCSFCAMIEWPSGSGGPWVEPEVYYQRGGASEVRISHGVCPSCAGGMDGLVS